MCTTHKHAIAFRSNFARAAMQCRAVPGNYCPAREMTRLRGWPREIGKERGFLRRVFTFEEVVITVSRSALAFPAG